MNKWMAVFTMLALIVAPLAFADEEKKEEKAKTPEEKRARIDDVADEALQSLFREGEGGKKLHSAAYGWAVFDNLKIAVGSRPWRWRQWCRRCQRLRRAEPAPT